MSRSERIETDACGISRRWSIAPHLARMLVRTNEFVRQAFSADGLRWPGLYILSGFRTVQRQAAVNPDNPNSLHLRCPALAVDLRVGDAPASTTPIELWAIVGQRFKLLGGRWGGDFPVPDPNHFDVSSVGL